MNQTRSNGLLHSILQIHCYCECLKQQAKTRRSSRIFPKLLNTMSMKSFTYSRVVFERRATVEYIQATRESGIIFVSSKIWRYFTKYIVIFSEYISHRKSDISWFNSDFKTFKSSELGDIFSLWISNQSRNVLRVRRSPLENLFFNHMTSSSVHTKVWKCWNLISFTIWQHFRLLSFVNEMLENF